MHSNDASKKKKKKATKSLNNNLFRLRDEYKTSVASFDDGDIDYMA